MLVNACPGYPSFQCLTAGFIGRECEYTAVLGLPFVWLSYEFQYAIAERNNNTAILGVSLGFVLLKFQNLVGIVHIGKCQVFNIAKTETAIQRQNECSPYLGILAIIVRCNQSPFLFKGKHVFSKHLVIYYNPHPLTRVFVNYPMLLRVLDYFLKTLVDT